VGDQDSFAYSSFRLVLSVDDVICGRMFVRECVCLIVMVLDLPDKDLELAEG